MNYKVGDKPRVRKDLHVGMRTKFGVNDEMANIAGKTVTITAIHGDCYDINGNVWGWTDDMFEPTALATGQMKAYDLMKLAAENPELYEGKRYKAIESGRISTLLCFVDELIIKDGILKAKANTDTGYATVWVTSYTKLEEIPAPPKPIDRMEAVKAYNEGKKVVCTCHGIRHKYHCENSNVGFTDENGSAVSAGEMLYGIWTVEP